MRKIVIEIEVDDDFEPCTYGCRTQCPFGYTDDDYDCVHLHCVTDGYGWSCPVQDAMEKENKTN